MQWLQKFLKKNPLSQGVVGISFLPEGIAIAVSRYLGDTSLKLMQCEFIEAKKNEDRLTALKRCVTAYKLHLYDCHLVLDINDYRRLNIEAPTVPENEIPLAVRWKITELLDFSVDDAIIDYYPMPVLSEDRSMIEVIASSRFALAPLIEQCNSSGLALKVIDIQETCLRNLAVLSNKNPVGVSILYLQKSFGLILIQKEGVIYLARKIAIGYERLNLTTLLDKEFENNPALDNLALEVQRSLDYVENYYRMGVIAGLAIIPWNNTTQNLVEKLNDDYGMTAYIMDLSDTVNCDIPLDYLTQSLCAPSIGATLRNTLISA